MSTTVNITNQTGYANDIETIIQDEQYHYQNCMTPLCKSPTDESEPSEKVTSGKKKFKPAPAKAKDHTITFEEAPAKAREYDSSFKLAPAKANDHTESSSTSNQTTPKNNDKNISKADAQNSISAEEKENIERSNETAKDSGKNISVPNNSGDIISSDPSFILQRFRSGDPELFKLLSDPALGPILMAKIQDAAAAETRMHTLLSNLQKAKDDTLKAIVNNIR
ncbi:MAG: hypothetical protein N3B13_07795 [Deltaproteobacteria bacterium]|nr:hypothetical protein [Deltaproteobacteria bacterium]